MSWAFHWVPTPLGGHDEGILFTDAFLMDQGQVIYRDFYANYPPGIFQVIRLITAVGLPPIWTERLLGWLEHLLAAIGAGLVAGRRRREGIVLAAAAVVLILRAKLWCILTAYKVAVLIALAAIALWPDQGSSRGRRLACGALLGLTSYFRLDFFVWSLLLLGSLELTCWIVRRHPLLAASRRELVELAAATAATALLLWVPLLVQTGVSRPLHDLVIDQMLKVQPGLLLPLPSFTAPAGVPALGWSVPALVADRACVALLLAFAGVGSAALSFLVAVRRPGSSASDLRSLALLCAFAAATLPQALMRTEFGHIAVGLPLTVPALLGVLGRRLGVPALLLALVPNLVSPLRMARVDEVARFLKDRDDASFMSPKRRRLTRFIQSETEGHERIFVGCTSHRRVLSCEEDAYYLVRRRGASRYMQFDPGTITSAEVQSQMIAELERHRPRIALLLERCVWDEPNASRLEGSGLLDDYLAVHYEPAGKVGGFKVRRRRQSPGPAHHASGPLLSYHGKRRE